MSEQRRIQLEKILISNTLTKQKAPLVPLEDSKIKMYACGITVYDHSHIGHAMQAIFFDVIRNYLQFAGYEVTYVRNYTDIDDKIIKRAAESGISPKALAESMIQSTDEDLLAVGVKPADYQPKVSDCIPEIIDMIQDLIKNEAAYPTEDGDVYYRVRSKKDYGKLSNRNPDELRSGTRDIQAGRKEDPLDFALWKKDNTLEASWSSPWSTGRPGWHIECSVMAKKYLGTRFDIHGGGLDLVFPHHENEIAQSESANGCQYVNYWMHCGLMTINHQKMSKSLGNHITIKDFLQDWPPEVLRLAILSHHYTSNIDFSLDAFQKNLSRLIYFYDTIGALAIRANSVQESGVGLPNFKTDTMIQEFKSSMNDDFNTASALAELNKHFKSAQELLRGKQTQQQAITAKHYHAHFLTIGHVLGLFQENPEQFTNKLKDRFLARINSTQAEISAFINERKDARAAKNYARSDEIRDQLLIKGIILKDTPDGTIWTIDPEQIENS